MSAIEIPYRAPFLPLPDLASTADPSIKPLPAKPHRATLEPHLLATTFETREHANGLITTSTHPAIVAYRQAHPRRTLIYFGPYILLQTLGEGEFGKVKLGIHKDSYDEVAVKLIRRINLNGEARHAKVEREINVLRAVRHPNIVHLNDVIETEKYIGIILDFAKGGELFDHILAHRYLKEADAAKLFAQLVSGVHYLHQKSIVHRDLKLENLLLDKHRNIIITDFGFANRFSNRQDDLMATSCGSPCYAAPELVISEGAYAGTAADIWSCGVILYAMLSGYLPFDDDPANPDGDNINLLYRYIVATPLTFPQQLSAEARDLLSKMLVADPEKRCGMREVLSHPWLGEHIEFLSSTCLDLEAIALQSRMHTREMHRSLGQAVTRKKDPDLRDPVPTKILDTPQAGAQAMEAPFTNDLPSAKPTESVGGRHSSYVTSSQLGPSFDTPEDGQSRTQAAGAIEPNALEVDCNGGSKKKNHSEAGADFESRSPALDSNAASNVRPAFPVRQNRHTIQLEYDEASVNDTLCRQQIPSKVVSGRQLSESASASQSGNSFRSTALQDTREPRQRVACTSNLSATSKSLDSNSETALVLPDSTGTAKDVVISPKTFVDDSEFTETKLSPPPDPVRLLSFERSITEDALQPLSSLMPRLRNAPFPSGRTAQPSGQTEPPHLEIAKSGRHQSSTSAAKKVMDWFRRRSRKITVPAPEKLSLSPRAVLVEPTDVVPAASKPASFSLSELHRVSHTTQSNVNTSRAHAEAEHDAPRPTTIASKPTGVESPWIEIPIHTGLIDQNALTTKSPDAVMKLVASVLDAMNIQVGWETKYRLKCVRDTTRDNEGNLGKSRTMLDRMSKRLSVTHYGFGSTAASPEERSFIHKQVNEVRFSIELKQLQNLPGLYLLDIKRLKGNIWTYKDLYQEILSFVQS